MKTRLSYSHENLECHEDIKGWSIDSQSRQNQHGSYSRSAAEPPGKLCSPALYGDLPFLLNELLCSSSANIWPVLPLPPCYSVSFGCLAQQTAPHGIFRHKLSCRLSIPTSVGMLFTLLCFVKVFLWASVISPWCIPQVRSLESVGLKL